MTQNNNSYNNFNSWGGSSASYTGTIPMKPSSSHSGGSSCDNITLREDLSTPELDYVLDVDGREKGRIVIPESENIPETSINNLFN